MSIRGFSITASLVIALTLFSGCRSVARPSAPVYLTNGRSISLLHPAEIETDIDALQRIEGSYGRENFMMDAIVKADRTGICLILLNGFGTELAELTYTADGAVIRGPMVTGTMKPEYIVADFQLAYYATDAVERELKKRGFELEEKRNGDRVSRTIRENGKAIIRLERTAESLVYNNILRGYEYRIFGEAAK